MKSPSIGRLAIASGLTTLLLPALLGLSLEGQTPPRDLHLVGDHWTAWDPPAVFEEGAEIHIVERGDTLWDLAARFYGNSYLWPQIWERNQYILDAHWIYPGDPLVLGIEVEPAEALEAPQTTATAADSAEPEALDTMFGRRDAFVQLGTPDDIYCSGYVGPMDEEFPYQVIGSEYEVLGPSLQIEDRAKISAVFGVVDAIKVGLTPGDVLYIDGGRAGGMTPGDVYVAVKGKTVVRGPNNGKVLGRFYEYLGRVRVLSVQEETAIAEISQACQPMYIGSVLKRFVPEPVPSERRTPMRPINAPVSLAELDGAPSILHAKDGLVSMGQDHVVFVGLGENDAVEAGDVFTVYRRAIGGKPPVILGEVGILSVHEMSSVAKVLESRFPIYVGDLLHPK